MTKDSGLRHTILDAIGAEIDAELSHLPSSADPTDADEPIRDPYATRLQNLRDAVVRVHGLAGPGATAG
jgi:hypothetical protein